MISVLEKIEKRRGSKKTPWRLLLLAKDVLWSIRVLILKMKFYLDLRFSKGKFPDFIIIGAMKGGTTFLWKYLKKHPDIQMAENHFNKSNKKEVRFFDEEKNWMRGKRWYRRLFNDNNKLQGEKSPEYLNTYKSHKRMYKTVPRVKLIILLRNPVTRAFSEWNMERISYERTLLDKKKIKRGPMIEKLSFEQTIKDNPKIIERGLYISQINNLMRYYPRSQILILISEKMKKTPQESYDEVLDFLGLKRIKIKPKKEVNKAGYIKLMRKETENLLYQFYEPYNQELFNFLGYEIKEWKNKK